ncbi:ankyrin repeat and IBR domain-containing protein 1-like [Oculina patagonica]
MGSSTSKFRKALQRGEGVEAMHIYLKNPDIKRNLDPNCSFGVNHGHNTALHYASLHAMKAFVREFLEEKANPNIQNAVGQNALHCICSTYRGSETSVDKTRAECLSNLLGWNSSLQDETAIEIDARDEAGNTPLHYAASSGLYQCVQLLVGNGASLYEENKDGETACDCAIKRGFNTIASFLESRMVFSETPSANAFEEPVFINKDDQKQYRGLCAQDLQEAKDLMLVETADMLRVPLFTAEGLLRNHEWSKEALIEAWMADPVAACEKAGVTLPENHVTGNSELEEKTQQLSMKSNFKTSEVCSICEDRIVYEDVPLSLSCGHEFCRSCWEGYLNVKIKEGKAHSIQCPAYDCSALVPVETIESLVSREMARRYLQFDIKAFVESNPTLKWCPSPGCGQAVRLPSSMLPSLNVAVEASSSEETEPMIVDCGKGHFFCWHCLNEAHAPCACQLWSKWLKKIAEMMPKIPTTEDISECPETEVVANTLWLVTNSKSCPNCKSPIQKNEGCNHMKCTKCKHEFCWVCLEQWKKHSSATGGYFRCNRFEIVQKVESESVKLVTEASTRNDQITELNCFLHYYSRFKNHENSYKFEEPLLSTAKDKMTALALAAMETAATSAENADTAFIEDAVHELLNARRVLRASYAYGYYLTGNKDKKAIFESMQTEVEEATETLSQMVARPYLRTPRAQIIQTTQLLHRKRQDFLLALTRGLIPDDDEPQEPRSFVSRLRLLSPSGVSQDSESDEDEDNYDEVRCRIEQSIIKERLSRLAAFGSPDSPPVSSDAVEDQAAAKEKISCEAIHKRFNLTACYLCKNGNGKDKREEKKKRRHRRSQPAEIDEELDVDFMRAIQLSLLQHSTPANQRSRQSSSSSSSASSNRDQAQGVQTPQDLSVFSVVDGASLQKAIELSLQDSAVGEVSSSPDDDLKKAIKLSLQDSGLPPAGNDGSGHTDSSSQSHQSKRQQDSDSDSECDYCF